MGYILVAEDDPYIQLLIKQKLQSAGYDVRCVANGKDAYTMAKTERPSLMIVDVLMPEMDGLTLCRTIKAEDVNAPPILIVSARGDTLDVDAAEIAGADQYLIKPFPLRELLSLVQNLLGRSV